MIEQVGNAVTFYVFYTASKVGKTGLSPTVDVYRGSTQIVTGASATALEGGIYYYTLASGSVTSENEYLAIFKTTDSSVDQQHIPALWVVGRAGIENLDATISSRATPNAVWATALPGGYLVGTAGARLGAVSGGQVTVVAPVTEDGDATVRQGKDYASSIGTALVWTLTNPPMGTPTSVTFTCQALNFSKACNYSSPTITLELTSTETAAFSAGVFPFEIEAVLSGLKHPGLVSGNLTVKRDV